MVDLSTRKTNTTFTEQSFWAGITRWAPLIFIVLAFLFWGGRTLWDTSEGRYGQAAFEMLHSGNWLVPSLAGHPHLTKPALTYWLIGLGMKIFGVNAWGARFFLSAAFLGTIFAVRELAKAMGFSRHQAVAAALIYATGAIPFGGGHTLTTDGFLALWETLGMLAAWKIWYGDERKIPYWRLVFWIAFALAFLTKGPPGWLALVVIGAYLLLQRNKTERRKLFSPACFVLFLIISFSWYGIIILQQHQMLEYFLKDEVYKRIFTTAHHRNAPFWIYAPILTAGVGPWLVLWPWLLRRAWQFAPGRGRRLEGWPLFLVLWVLLPLLVFTVAKSRMIFYVLPLFVPISLAMGKILPLDFLPLLAKSQRWRKIAIGVAVFWALVLVIYTGGLDLLSRGRSMRTAAGVFNEKIEQMGGPSRQCYWIWAGRQRYSLGFYMQRVIMDAENLELFATAAKNATTASPLFVTSEESFTDARRGKLPVPKTVELEKLATAQDYVLFTILPEAHESKSDDARPLERRI